MSKEQAEEIIMWCRIGAKNTLTLHECAAYIGISDGRLYNLVNAREVPHSRSRGRLYFSKSEIDRWLTESHVADNGTIDREAAEIATRLRLKNF